MVYTEIMKLEGNSSLLWILHYKDFIENNIDLIDEFNYSSLFRELHYCTLREQNKMITLLFLYI